MIPSPDLGASVDVRTFVHSFVIITHKNEVSDPIGVEPGLMRDVSAE